MSTQASSFRASIPFDRTGILRINRALTISPTSALKGGSFDALNVPPTFIARADTMIGSDNERIYCAAILVPVGSTPSDFARFIRDELEKWTNGARIANIKSE